MPALVGSVHTAVVVGNNEHTTLDITGVVIGTATDSVHWVTIHILGRTGAEAIFDSVTLDPGGANETAYSAVQAAGGGDLKAFNIQGQLVMQASAFKIINPPTGTFTVRAILTETVHDIGGIAWQTDDTDQTDPVGATDTHVDISSAWSPVVGDLEITTTAAGSLLWATGTLQGAHSASSATFTEQADFPMDGPGGRDATAAAFSIPEANASTAVDCDADWAVSEDYAVLMWEILAAGGAAAAGGILDWPLAHKVQVRR